MIVRKALDGVEALKKAKSIDWKVRYWHYILENKVLEIHFFYLI